MNVVKWMGEWMARCMVVGRWIDERMKEGGGGRIK
jgi:hypothetical protein